MRNQTIKNPAPTLKSYDSELGPPLDAKGNPLSPNETEAIKAKTSEFPRHSTKEEMAKQVEGLSQPGILAGYVRVNGETGERFEAELETQRENARNDARSVRANGAARANDAQRMARCFFLL